MKSQALKHNEFLDEIDEATYRIQACGDEFEVTGLVHELLHHFGAESFVFISLSRDCQSRESFRFLVGCAPKWCQIYNAKKWFAIDPFIRYALHNSSPILGSTIKSESPGQTELLDTAAENGFRSGMVIPTHAGNQSRIGLLYVGCSTPPEQAEPILTRNRNRLRAIAMELFEWTETKLNADSIAHYEFDSIDIELLKLECKGFTAEDAANTLHYSVAVVNHRFLRINEKLEVRHKKDAVKRALELGILRGFG